MSFIGEAVATRYSIDLVGTRRHLDELLVLSATGRTMFRPQTLQLFIGLLRLYPELASGAHASAGKRAQNDNAKSLTGQPKRQIAKKPRSIAASYIIS